MNTWENEYFDLIDVAMNMATIAHNNQYRKGNNEPYIQHPIRVSNKIKECGIKDETCIIAALIHDVVEDSDFDLNDVRKNFGTDVARIVDLLTRDSSMTYNEYINRLLSSNDPYVLLIKYYDANDNSVMRFPDGSTKPMPKYIRLMEKLREAINQCGYGSFIIS